MASGMSGAAYAGPVTEACPRDPQVQSAFGTLMTQLEQLSIEVNRLADRATPVLRPCNGAKDAAGNSPPVPVRAPLADQIWAANNLVSRIGNTIMDIQDRMEV